VRLTEAPLVGDRVRHPWQGLGTVERSVTRKVRVRFDNGEVRTVPWLALEATEEEP